MNYQGKLQTLPREIRIFLGTFVLVLSVGYFTGLFFVSETQATVPDGIEQNYLGNEEDTEAEIMIFKKSQREMLTIIHTHVLSIGFIFFLLGCLVWLARLPRNLKLFLTVEPFISLVLTFGGIYLMWMGLLWMKYLVFLSGMLMTLSFIAAAVLVFYQLVQGPGAKPKY